MPGPADDRSLGDLFRTLTDQASTLVQQEVDLVKAELREKQAQATPAVKTAVIAAVWGVIALAAATALVIIALGLLIPEWVAALLIAVVAGVIAAMLGSQARNALQAVAPIPEETVQTLKEDLEWAKSHRTSVPKLPQLAP